MGLGGDVFQPDWGQDRGWLGWQWEKDSVCGGRVNWERERGSVV